MNGGAPTLVPEVGRDASEHDALDRDRVRALDTEIDRQ